MTSNADEKKKWVKDKVGNMLEMIEPGSLDHILFENLGRTGERGIPLVEIKMNNKELA
jgi:hypothetical protein